MTVCESCGNDDATLCYDCVVSDEVESILIPLPWDKPPLTANPSLRKVSPHVTAAAVRQAKQDAQWAIRSARPRRIVGAEVVLHYRPKDKRRRDADNLFATLKACQDALVAEGVLPDDSWVCVPSATCRIHEPETNHGPAVWIELRVLRDYDNHKDTP